MKKVEKNMRFILGFLLLPLLPLTGFAGQEVGLSVGTNVSRGDHVPMDYYRLTYAWDWNKTWFNKGNWFVSAKNDLSIIRVLSDVEVRRKHAKSTLTAIAFTPLFRLRRTPYANGLAPFIEAGVGVSYFSASRIQSQPYFFRDYGGRFQFEDRFSIGLLYKEDYRFSIDFTHYSNLDIKPPNEGLDLVSATVAFKF